MRVAVGTDHAGLPLKQLVVAWLAFMVLFPNAIN